MIENPFESFEKAVFAIMDSNIEPFSGLAERGVQRLIAQEIMLGVNIIPPRLRATTVFGMQPISRSLKQEHYPIVMVELADAVAMEGRVLQGEVIRTLAVVDQYPFSGYERRLKTVYDEALDTQQLWLERTNTPEIPLDPRKTDRNQLIQQLLGPARYGLDAGWQDWQATIDELLKSGLFGKDEATLRLLRESQSHFLIQRHLQQPSNYMALTAEGRNLDELTEDQRAQLLCAAIIGASIISKPPTQN